MKEHCQMLCKLCKKVKCWMVLFTLSAIFAQCLPCITQSSRNRNWMERWQIPATIGVYVCVWGEWTKKQTKDFDVYCHEGNKTWSGFGRPVAKTLHLQCGMAKKKKKRINMGDLMVSGWRGCPSKMGNQKRPVQGLLIEPVPHHTRKIWISWVKPLCPPSAKGVASSGEEGC